jgi:hypothetical protein
VGLCSAATGVRRQWLPGAPAPTLRSVTNVLDEYTRLTEF